MNHRSLMTSLVVAVLLAVAACGGASESSGTPVPVPPLSESEATMDSEGNPAPVSNLTSTEDVIAAVAVADSIESLPDDLTPPLADAGADTPWKEMGDRGCLPNFETVEFDYGKCAYGDQDSDEVIVILGDSHASMWLPTLDLIGRVQGYKVIPFAKVSCGAADIADPYLYQEERFYEECIEWHAWAHAEIAAMEPDLVLLTNLVNERRAGPDKAIEPDYWQEAMEKTIAEVSGEATDVAILGDIPEMQSLPLECLAKNSGSIAKCATPAEIAVKTLFNDAERRAADNGGGAYIDPIEWFCTETCSAVIASKVVYSDKQHITVTYAEHVAGALAEQIDAILGQA